jgi:hypothetical protein
MPRILMSVQSIAVLQPGTGRSTCVATDTSYQTAASIEQMISTNNILNADATEGNEAGGSADAVSKPSQARDHERSPPIRQHGETYVEIRTKAIGKSCRKSCICQCHIPFQGETPRWLRGLLGNLFFSFTGTPVLNHRSCNISSCGADPGSGGAVKFRYTFPTWILSKSIHVIGDWTDLTGMGAVWSFQIPQMYTCGHMVMFLFDSFYKRQITPYHFESLVSSRVRPVDSIQVDFRTRCQIIQQVCNLSRGLKHCRE